MLSLMLSLISSLGKLLHPAASTRRLPAHRGSRASVLALVGLLMLTSAMASARVTAQPHDAPAQQPTHGAPSGGDHAKPDAEHAESGGVLRTVAKLFNFALLVGILVYYLKSPIAAYMTSRSTQIRQDLVAAAEMRAAASAQLAEIEQKLKSLPAELEALKAQGAEDVRAEKARIAHTAAAERERLLEQTRREIDMRLRIARRQLVELAAELAVGVARQRITRSITPDDQMRLLDVYTAQLAKRGPRPRV